MKSECGRAVLRGAQNYGRNTDEPDLPRHGGPNQKTTGSAQPGIVQTGDDSEVAYWHRER